MMGGTVIIACRSEDKAMEVRAAKRENRSTVFQTRSDTKRPVQLQ